MAREVGVEGKLGGQANVPGAAGTWKDLTDNVNQLAANLTTQVRAIAEVATAVTKGDLTRSITVEAQGEVAELKDNINEMIRNLRDTTQKNTEQDWLKTNLAKFTAHAAGPARPGRPSAQLILSELAPLVGAQQGVFYVLTRRRTSSRRCALLASYASDGARRLRQASSSWARAWSASARCEQEAHPADRRARRLRARSRSGLARGAAAQHHGAAGAVRRRGQGGDRAGLVRALQRRPTWPSSTS